MIKFISETLLPTRRGESDCINTKVKKMGHAIGITELSDEQLENVSGGMSVDTFYEWKLRLLNEDR